MQGAPGAAGTPCPLHGWLAAAGEGTELNEDDDAEGVVVGGDTAAAKDGSRYGTSSAVAVACVCNVKLCGFTPPVRGLILPKASTTKTKCPEGAVRSGT